MKSQDWNKIWLSSSDLVVQLLAMLEKFGEVSELTSKNKQ
jgi:hypothetical protein